MKNIKKKMGYQFCFKAMNCYIWTKRDRVENYLRATSETGHVLWTLSGLVNQGAGKERVMPLGKEVTTSPSRRVSGQAEFKPHR
jgi:hypothetical protein